MRCTSMRCTRCRSRTKATCRSSRRCIQASCLPDRPGLQGGSRVTTLSQRELPRVSCSCFRRAWA